ncbi:MAG: hypothetical protein C5B52_16735 [Bacteroidetes bacterium]|nr:MAG: hypothetical protein C5B52_16735 [Bacteroidota bacterium]
MNCFRLILILFPQLIFLSAISQPAIIDSLQGVVKENKLDAEEVRALNELATNYARTDFAKAKTYLYRSIELSKTLNNNVLLSQSYSQMVILQLNTGNADSSQYYLNLLKNLNDNTELESIKGNYNFTAGLYFKLRGNFKAALPFMIKSLNESETRLKSNPVVANKITLAGQTLNIGNVYNNMGDCKSALQYHLKALQLFEELNNKKGISFCYQGIGTDFLQLGQLKQAMLYTIKAKELKTELSDERGIAVSLEQMGSISVEQKQYDSALNYFMQSMKIMQQMKLVTEEANLNTEIGRLYTIKKDPENARFYYSNSRQLAQQVGDSSRVAADDAALISLATTISKQKSDEKKLMSSLQTSIESGDKLSELANYQFLSDHYVSVRQFDKALEYTNKYHEVNDSLQSMEVQMQMKKMEEQFNLDKKEKEIALLKKDQQLSHLSLEKQKVFQYGAILFLLLLVLIAFLFVNRYRIVQNARRLIEMEKMRNRIAQDLHDDIGSTLSSISVLSNVALQTQDQGDLLVRTNLRKIKERSTAIMESMDDIVWAINPRNDTMSQLLLRMKEFAAEILEPLNIQYSFEEIGNFSSTSLDIKKRKDLYLIFKEAINNAAKYSQCKNIQIFLKEERHSLQIEIIDDGKGFVEQHVRNGNGLKNMRERAFAIGAKILIESSLAKGTHINLNMAIT